MRWLSSAHKWFWFAPQWLAKRPSSSVLIGQSICCTRWRRCIRCTTFAKQLQISAGVNRKLLLTVDRKPLCFVAFSLWFMFVIPYFASFLCINVVSSIIFVAFSFTSFLLCPSKQAQLCFILFHFVLFSLVVLKSFFVFFFHDLVALYVCSRRFSFLHWLVFRSVPSYCFLKYSLQWRKIWVLLSSFFFLWLSFEFWVLSSSFTFLW